MYLYMHVCLNPFLFVFFVLMYLCMYACLHLCVLGNGKMDLNLIFILDI